MTNKIGIIVLAHGSRLDDANQGVLRLVEALQRSKGSSELSISAAFMQFGTPSLEEVVHNVVENGCKEILIAPLFLTSGAHITEDIPEMISKMREMYLDVQLKQCSPLGCDEKLIPILWDRVSEFL